MKLAGAAGVRMQVIDNVETMMFEPRFLGRRAVLAAAAFAVALTGCATLAPGSLPPGTPIATARQALFGPSGEYALPGGGTRLEFRQGSFGRQTFMLDFDPAGLLVSSQQVLTEPNFATIAPGMPEHEVLMRLGHPAYAFDVQWQKLHVWNYRFFGGDCVWFQVSISNATQQVTEAGIGPDPACDAPEGKGL